MNTKYEFDPAAAYETIKEDWTQFAERLNVTKWVLGVSGGKDSTVVAWLAAKIFGPTNVIGVMMPNGVQHDIADSEMVISKTKIMPLTINIESAFVGLTTVLKDKMNCNDFGLKSDVTINLPPRLRMATVYAVAQQMNAMVLNTSNLTEDILGYATLWGDTCGSYAPIQGLTVTEVIQLGEWLGIPEILIRKVPADGLQGSCDEDKLGLKYADADKLIRMNEATDELRAKVLLKYKQNKFKIDMIHLTGPKFLDLPNFVKDEI